MALALDSFNRANGSIGSNYATLGGAITVNSGQALVGSTFGVAVWAADDFGSDQFVEFTVTAIPTVSGAQGAALRYDTSTANGYIVTWDNDNGSIRRIDSGVDTVLPNSGFSAPSVGTRVRAVMVDDTIRLYFNGVLQVEVSDSTYTSGSPGLFGGGDSTARFDDMVCGDYVHIAFQLVTVDSDTFDSDIGSGWTLGEGDWDSPVWNSTGGGTVQNSGNEQDTLARRNTGSYGEFQWSRVYIHTLSAADWNAIAPIIHKVSGPGESTYTGYVTSASEAPKYAIYRVDNSFDFHPIMERTDIPGAALAANDSILILKWAGYVMLFTSENGGPDILRAFGEDDNITNGWPGFTIYSDTAGNARITAWEGGNVEALSEGGEPQDIEPSGIASAEAFGAPSIESGAVAVSPTGIGSAEAFGSPSIAPGAVSVAPAGIASTEAFGSPAIAPGAVAIAPSGIPSGESFGSPTVAAGAATVAPAGIASAEAFGSPALTTGEVSLAPAGIASAEAFGNPTVSAGATLIAPQGIPSAEAFGTPELDLDIIITGIASLEAFGTPAVQPGEVVIAPSGIGSAEAFGTATFAALVGIAPQGIISAEAFGSPTVAPGAVSIAPTGIASAEAFGSPSLEEISVIAPQGIASAEAFGAATITTGEVTIAPSGIPSAEAFGAHALTGEGELLTVGIPSAEAFGAPSIIQQYHSGYYIDGENEIEIDEVYGKLTTYSDGNGGFYSI